MFSISKKINNYEDSLILVFVFSLITVGIYFRFLDVGKWCFAVDEFFTATSINKILDNGIPRFANGGYYVRGILFQYFEAFLSLIFGFNEGTLRYGSIFFSLLTLPGVYFLGKRIGGKTLGFVAIGIFSISLWEVEFSRFIRMYTAFQCLFVWYLIILIKVIIDKDISKLKWLYSIAICSVFVHEGSIFLILLLFLPLLFEFAGEKKRHVLISSIILLSAYFYIAYDFRHFGLTGHLPQDYQKVAGSSKIILPNLYFLNTIIETKGWLLVYVLVAFVNSYFIYRLWRDINLTSTKRIIISILMLLSLMQMFGVCTLFLLGVLIIDKINVKDITNKTVRKTIGCIGITFGFWFLYGVFTGLWVESFENLSGVSIKKILVVLFKYPNIFDSLIYPYIGAIPILSFCLLISFCCVLFIILFRQKRDIFSLQVITLVLISCIVVLAILPTPYRTTRYSFFLYPIFIILFSYAIKYFIGMFGQIKYQSSLFFFSALFLFINTDDFKLNHLMNIGSPEINFRMHYNMYKSGHFYGREDFKSPSDFINNNANKNDVIISTFTTCSYYLNKLDYVYVDYNNPNFAGISTLNGTKEFWTSSNLLFKVDDLLHLIINSQEDIWLIVHSEKYMWNNTSKRLSEVFSKFKVYTSIDGRLNVLKIPSGAV